MIATGGSYRQESESRRQEDYKVRLLLESLGLEKLSPRLIERQLETCGENRLTFLAFHEAVPDFPINLRFRLLFNLDEHSSCSLREMIVKPENSLIYQAWKAVYDQLADAWLTVGRAVGLIFPYAGIPGGLIVHDWQYPARSMTVQGRRYLFDVNDKQIVLERYVHVLAAIKDSSWSPGRWPAPRIPIPPFLRRVKGAREKLVLQLFLSILNGEIEQNPDWAARVELIKRVHGDRWIVISHQEIADALGLTVDQVRRALRVLRECDIVQSKSGESGNMYRVDVETVLECGKSE